MIRNNKLGKVQTELHTGRYNEMHYIKNTRINTIKVYIISLYTSQQVRYVVNRQCKEAVEVAQRNIEQILDKYSVAGLWTLYTCLHIIPYISLYIDIYVYIYMMQEFVQCLNSSDLFYFSLRITEVFIIITLKGSDLYVQHIYSGVSLLGHNSKFQPSVFGFLVLSCTSYEDDTFFCRYPI